LPPATQDLLERLGVHDRGLPRPEENEPDGEILPLDRVVDAAPQRPIPANDFEDDHTSADDSEIGALVRRIEAFRKHRAGRTNGEEAPRLPLGERSDLAAAPLAGFAFTTDAEGKIDWAEPSAAPMIVGARLPLSPFGPHYRQPIAGLAISWEGAPAISGEWVIDAGPRFSEIGGRFAGYAGRFRRPSPPTFSPAGADPTADRLRQLIHELKTPVNAIQGFAEVIQQQLFGPAPHEYRALAATIAGDAARILAGFDELDRLAKLESGTVALEPGHTDWTEALRTLAVQLDDVLRARGGGIQLDGDAESCAIAIDKDTAEALGWRLLATLAGAAGANERISLRLMGSNGVAALTATLPASLARHDNLFGADIRASAGAVSAGMFGAGFALRLARAEARAAGGDLLQENGAIVLTLPRLTVADAGRSRFEEGAAHG
jgi:signal transduction histidine kinase